MDIRSSVARFTELRRALPIVAAGLLLAALLFPMWRITLQAPQYTDDLIVELYAYPRVAGDYAEVAALNQYVGFYYPDPVFVEPNYEVHENAIKVPEWTFGPLAFIGVAATGAFVALAPTERKLKLGLTAQLAGTIVVFAGMFAVIQYRLHQAGHTLDPDAPLEGVSGFTPPVIGSYEVANITGFAWVGIGGEMAMAAVLLLFVAFYFRDSTATLGDVPGMVARLPGAASERISSAITRSSGSETEVARSSGSGTRGARSSGSGAQATDENGEDHEEQSGDSPEETDPARTVTAGRDPPDANRP